MEWEGWDFSVWLAKGLDSPCVIIGLEGKIYTIPVLCAFLVIFYLGVSYFTLIILEF